VLDKSKNTRIKKRTVARDEVYEVLNQLINDEMVLDMNHRELSRVLRNKGITPLCKRGNCMVHESATAISTIKVNMPGLHIRSNQARQTFCDCQWAYLAGFVSKP
jgi:hypothetical protein